MPQQNSESPSQPQPMDAWDRVLAPWWGKVLVGVVILIGAYLSARDLAKFEGGAVDTMLLSRTTRVLYDLGGRWLAIYAPATLGLAFVAWGVVQLVRTAPVLQPPHVRPADGPPGVGPGEMSYAQALYESFWKAWLALIVFVESAIVLWVMRTGWGEVSTYAGIIAVLAVVAVAYVQLELFARAMGWDDSPLVAWRERVTWLVIGGYGLAMGLAIMLAVAERPDPRIEQEAVDFKAEQKKLTSSDDYKRGMEAVRQINAIKAAEQERLGREPTRAELTQALVKARKAEAAATRPK